MNRSSKIFLSVLLFLLVSLLLVFMIGWATASAPHPVQHGSLTLPGLQDEVQVLRDQYGIAHIYAQNEHDLFMAQGYVHAQDRFWQMEFWRYTGQGRLSEIIGEAGVSNDRFIRTVGWNRIGEETIAYYQTEAPDFYEILEWYSAGVNAYLAENQDNFSLNQTILTAVNGPREIEPWTPLNTVTWGVVMAHDLGGNYTTELRRARLLAEVSPELVEQIWPPFPYDRRPVIAPTDLLQPMPTDTAVSPLAPQTDWSAVNLDLIGATPDLGFALGNSDFAGSNNWVVSGQHTASGLPLLANDPHLGIQMPSIWYQVGLHAPGFNVTGFSFAGVPGVVVGYNDRIAWGVTNVGPDTQDLFIEKINPANPNQYEFEGEWRDIERIEEVIKVSGGDDVVLPVRFTHHGPILSDEINVGDQVLAFQWTSSQPSPLLQSVILLNRAQNFADFVDALRYWDAAGQNIVYADVEGNIGYQTTGVVPVRRTGDGTVPAPGWTGEYEWVGTVPYEEMPRLYNPPSGYIVTANNAVVDEAYPHFIDRDWADGDRALRIERMIEELIAQKGQLTAVDMTNIHTDSYSQMAETYVPHLLALAPTSHNIALGQEVLTDWNYQAGRHSGEALLFETFLMNLLPAIVADELGETASEDYIYNSSAQFIFLHNIAADPASPLWDDVTTPDVVETRERILGQALNTAVQTVRETHGSLPSRWQWGDIHTATFVSNPLGQSGIDPIERLVNRGPFPADGGFSLVNANSWRWDNPAAVRGHVSMRFVADLADFDQSLAVIPTGQSGHPGHRNYDDQIGLWLNGGFVPLVSSEAAVRNTAVRTLILRP